MSKKSAVTATTVKDYSRDVPGAIVGTRWEFPSLHYKGKTGADLRWVVQVSVRENEKGKEQPILLRYLRNEKMPPAYVAVVDVLSYSTLGKLRSNVSTIVKEGKNKNRSNETNVFCQGLREALRRWNLQKKKTDQGDRFAPMLASIYKDKNFSLPAWIQRKYDGIRAIATIENEKVCLYSRKGTDFPSLDYIEEESRAIIGPHWEKGRHVHLDGELYSHGTPLQEISGYARRDYSAPRAGTQMMLTYMVYDCFVPGEDLNQSQRFDLLEDLFSSAKKEFVLRVPTIQIYSKIEGENLFEQFIREKFEGAMLRTNGAYVYGQLDRRSTDLMKMKKTHDAEFEIVGWKRGKKGKAAGALILVCKTVATPTTESKTFSVSPAVELQRRHEIANQMTDEVFAQEWEGQMLTVYFDDKSADGVPLRGRTRLERRTASSI